eukprot:92645_1
MATVQPPRKKRKLCTITQYISNHNTNVSHRKDTNTKIKNGKIKPKKKSINIDNLMQLIENEPNEQIETRILKKIIKILKSEIEKNKQNNKLNYSLYLKLSWAYLRIGTFTNAISYFTQILPQRDHPKFYQIEPQQNTNNTNHNNQSEISDNEDIKNAEENSNSNPDSDIKIHLSKKQKKKRKHRKKAIKKLNKLESNHPKLNKNNFHSVLMNDSDSDIETLDNIPLKYEISIRVNIGLMLCRICDFEEALRETFIMRDLYTKEFKHNNDLEYIQYDPYIDYIEMIVMYHQKYWYQCIEKAMLIIKYQNIKQLINKKKKCELICKLDNHSLFELYCILGDCYSRVGELEKGGEIFENIIIKHMKVGGNNEFDFSVKYHWIYEIYLRYLYYKKEWGKGYNFCMKLFASNVSYRYNENMMKLCERFNVEHYFNMNKMNVKRLYHFVIDAEHFGNQCRFVNHSDDVEQTNCIFTARYKYGATSCPSPVEVWLKCIKKTEKGEELLVDYGQNYWENEQSCNKLQKRDNWDDGFIFTHLVMDEMESYVDIKRMIEKHHMENVLLGDKKYPNSIVVQKDKHGGFGAFATKTIKKDTFILRYAGIRKLCTNHDVSKSRYSIIQKFTS